MQYVKTNYSNVLKGKASEIGCVVFDKGKSNNSITESNCVNGTFFSYEASGNYYSTSPLIVNGKAYRWASNHGVPQSCFIIYKDNTVDMKRIKSISELDISKIKFLFGGVGLVNKKDATFKYNPASEGFSGKFSDVLRNCEKTIIASRGDEVFLLTCKLPHSSTSYDLLDLCKEHNFDMAVSLDGGGSTIFKYNNVVKESGDGRKIHHIITMNGIDETPKKPELDSVCLDYGHRNNQSDFGATNKGVKESELALKIGKKIKEQLEKNKVKVIETRKSEQETISLNDRCKIANTNKVDLFLSIHINSFSNVTSNGVEVLHYKGQSNKDKAKKMCDSICKYTGARNRGPVERNDLAVLRGTSMSALLVECGFISNEIELKLIQQEDYQDKIVQGIVESIGLTYYKQTTVPPVQPPVQDDTYYRVCVSSFKDEQQAKKLQQELITKGYKDTFIAKYTK